MRFPLTPLTPSRPRGLGWSSALGSTAGVSANTEQQIPEGGYANTAVLPALPSLDPGEPALMLQAHFAYRSVGRVFLCNHFEDAKSLVCLLAISNVWAFSIVKSSV